MPYALTVRTSIHRTSRRIQQNTDSSCPNLSVFRVSLPTIVPNADLHAPTRGWNNVKPTDFELQKIGVTSEKICQFLAILYPHHLSIPSSFGAIERVRAKQERERESNSSKHTSSKPTCSLSWMQGSYAVLAVHNSTTRQRRDSRVPLLLPCLLRPTAYMLPCLSPSRDNR